MTDTGCTLNSLATRSFEAATGTPTTTLGCSTSTTTGLTTTTTTLVSADPSLQHLDAGHAATEGSILVESVPQDPAKARRQAKPKTAAVPTGAVVGSGKKYPPYREDVYKIYFAVIRHLGIYDECVEPCAINRGGTKDTEKGLKLHWAIYKALS